MAIRVPLFYYSELKIQSQVILGGKKKKKKGRYLQKKKKKNSPFKKYLIFCT